MFDPEIDIAVIRTSGLAGPPLSLDTHPLDRGAPGAILGFPGGVAHIVAHRAAVSARFEAHGKDIYGRRDVVREVYELRTPIRQGDSGGPFVVPDGRLRLDRVDRRRRHTKRRRQHHPGTDGALRSLIGRGYERCKICMRARVVRLDPRDEAAGSIACP
jgi:hypothetical protein